MNMPNQRLKRFEKNRLVTRQHSIGYHGRPVPNYAEQIIKRVWLPAFIFEQARLFRVACGFLPWDVYGAFPWLQLELAFPTIVWYQRWKLLASTYPYTFPIFMQPQKRIQSFIVYNKFRQLQQQVYKVYAGSTASSASFSNLLRMQDRISHAVEKAYGLTIRIKNIREGLIPRAFYPPNMPAIYEKGRTGGLKDGMENELTFGDFPTLANLRMMDASQQGDWMNPSKEVQFPKKQGRMRQIPKEQAEELESIVSGGPVRRRIGSMRPFRSFIHHPQDFLQISDKTTLLIPIMQPGNKISRYGTFGRKMTVDSASENLQSKPSRGINFGKLTAQESPSLVYHQAPDIGAEYGQLAKKMQNLSKPAPFSGEESYTSSASSVRPGYPQITLAKPDGISETMVSSSNKFEEVNKVAEEVFTLLEKRLRTERERRGIFS